MVTVIILVVMLCVQELNRENAIQQWIVKEKERVSSFYSLTNITELWWLSTSNLRNWSVAKVVIFYKLL